MKISSLFKRKAVQRGNRPTLEISSKAARPPLEREKFKEAKKEP